MRSNTLTAIALMLSANLATHADDCPGFLAARTSLDVGGIPGFTEFADLDNDGDLDAVTTNVGDNTVSVLLNCGSGIFEPATHYPTGPQSQGLAIGDLNGDGFADVIVVSSDTFQDVVVLLGNGDGTLAPATTNGVLDDLSAVAAGDVDGDGDTDVVAANRGGSLDIYRNNGSGTFTSQTNLNVGGGQIEDVLIADFNNDSRLDLACIDVTNSTIILRIQNSFGSFLQSVTLGVGNTPTRLHADDLDGDGNIDLIASQFGAGEISVFFNESGLVFTSENVIGVADGPSGITSADFDDDGQTDLAIANEISAEIALLTNNGNRTFSAQYFDAGSTPAALAAADVTGDGLPELVVADATDNTLTLHHNRSGDINQELPLTGAFNSAAADIDNDGDLDVVVARSGSSDIAIYKNDNGLQSPPIGVNASGSTFDVALADIDNDGNVDLIVTQSFTPARLRVFKGNGDLTFQPSTLYTWGNQQGRYLVVEDFNGDGWLDIAATSLTGGDGLFLNDGAGDFVPGPTTTALTSARGIAAGDLDHDGDIDVAVVKALSNRIAVYLNDGAANFTLDDSYIIAIGPIEVLIADFNNDGTLDMAGTATGGSLDPGIVSTWLGNGDGSLGPANIVFAGAQAFGIDAADFDADGNVDIAWTFQSASTVSIVRGDGMGGFTPLADHPAGIEPVAVLAADVTGSGTPDLIVSNSGGLAPEVGSLTVLHNVCVACAGDIADDFGTLGADGMVSFGDFLALLGLVGPCPGDPGCTGDIADDFGTLSAGDGMVSFGDFLALLGLVGPCP